MDKSVDVGKMFDRRVFGDRDEIIGGWRRNDAIEFTALCNTVFRLCLCVIVKLTVASTCEHAHAKMYFKNIM